MERPPRSGWPIWASLLAIATCVATWAPALGLGFVWTDHAEIEMGLMVPVSASEALDMLLRDKSHAKQSPRAEHFSPDRPTSRYQYHRPVKSLSYGWDRLLGGQPWAFHLTNLLIHAGVCIALLLLGRRLARTRTPFLGEWLGLLFALHPLQTECVAWVSARSDSLMALFALSACVLLLRARAGRAWIWRGLCGLMVLLAVGSKETGVVCLPVLIALSLALPDGRRGPLRRVAVEIGPAALAVAVAVAFRFLVVGDIQLGSLAGRTGLGLWSGLDLFGRNLLTSFLPWGTGVADTIELLDQPSVLSLAGPVIWLTWLAAGIRLRRPLLWLGAIGWLLAVLPVSQVVPLLHPRGDRYLYLPSAFAMLSLVALAIEAGQHVSRARIRRLLVSAAALCLAVLALSSRTHLDTWKDERVLFAKAVQDQPACVECWNNLAYAEALAGRYPQAVLACERALSVDRHRYRGARDGFSLRWILAQAATRSGQLPKALFALQEILVHAGSTPATLTSLARVQLMLGRPGISLGLVELAQQTAPSAERLRLAKQAAQVLARSGFEDLDADLLTCLPLASTVR